MSINIAFYAVKSKKHTADLIFLARKSGGGLHVVTKLVPWTQGADNRILYISLIPDLTSFPSQIF